MLLSGWQPDHMQALTACDLLDLHSSYTSFEQYPLTEKTLKPASDPLYYYRIADAVDRATSEKGPKAKSWWRTFFALEAEGFKEKVRSGVLDERIGLPPRAVKTEGKAETAETN